MAFWLLSLGYLSPIIILNYLYGGFFPFTNPALYNFLYIIIGVVLFVFEYLNMGVRFIDDNDINYYAKLLTFFPMNKIIKRELRNTLKLQKISIDSSLDCMTYEVVLKLLEKHFESKYKKYVDNYDLQQKKMEIRKKDICNLEKRVREIRNNLNNGEFIVDDLPRPVEKKIKSF